MILLKQVLEVTFITTLHHVKQYFVTVLAWQLTAYLTNRNINNNFARQYIPEDNSEHHTRRRENLKSHRGIHNFLNKLLAF
jgi:hypothetical protein